MPVGLHNGVESVTTGKLFIIGAVAVGFAVLGLDDGLVVLGLEEGNAVGVLDNGFLVVGLGVLVGLEVGAFVDGSREVGCIDVGTLVVGIFVG